MKNSRVVAALTLANLILLVLTAAHQFAPAFAEGSAPVLGAFEPASGLSLAGPTGTRDTYLILEAKGEVAALKLRNEDGRESILTP